MPQHDQIKDEKKKSKVKGIGQEKGREATQLGFEPGLGQDLGAGGFLPAAPMRCIHIHMAAGKSRGLWCIEINCWSMLQGEQTDTAYT